MFANRNLVAALTVVGAAILCGNVHAQTQEMVVAPAAGLSATSSAVPLMRQSDTIGDAAEKQRTTRMLQTQRPVATAGAPMPSPMPAGALNGLPGGPQLGVVREVKTPEQEMMLTEVMRSPTLSMVTIEIFGVERKVQVGEELGNGWKVKSINRFSVDLVYVKATSSGKTNKSDKTDKNKSNEDAKPRTVTLTLRGNNGIQVR